jgi:hypothetical protein
MQRCAEGFNSGVKGLKTFHIFLGLKVFWHIICSHKLSTKHNFCFHVQSTHSYTLRCNRIRNSSNLLATSSKEVASMERQQQPLHSTEAEIKCCEGRELRWLSDRSASASPLLYKFPNCSVKMWGHWHHVAGTPKN